MDYQGVRQQGGQRRPRARGGKGSNPQLFDDTSTQPGFPPQPNPGYPADPNNPYTAQYGFYPEQGVVAGYGQQQTPQQQPTQQFNNDQGQTPFGGQQFMNDPMANMAMQYGTNLAGQGKDLVHKHMEQYVSASKLKYYFAVDTSYVGKKIGLLLFPYAHSDWSIRYNQDEPVAPRYELNAPDLYIPVMAFVTYMLLAGVILGTQNRFSPEMLGMTASSALVWMVIEILALLLAMYILNVTTDLKYLDLLSYCGYKYVGMLSAMVGGLLFSSMGYYLVLLWSSASLAFFLVRSLKMAIIPHSEAEAFTRGNKRRMYMLLVIAATQPIFMWWLTQHLVS